MSFSYRRVSLASLGMAVGLSALALAPLAAQEQAPAAAAAEAATPVDPKAVVATVDGQTTAHYITDLLASTDVKVTRLAHGVPVGGELDYLDEGTIAAAIRQRTPF